jgi:sugar-phosphatase
VLFDVDGVVLDSMAVFQRVWASWSILHGLDPGRVCALTGGRRPHDVIAIVAPHLDQGEEFLRLAGLLLEENAVLPAIPGAHLLLAGLPPGRWALVTSNSEGLVRGEFDRLGLPSPALVIDGASVQKGKPSPEGYLRAASLLEADVRDCLVVEDAPAGVEAGLAAGMRVLALETTHAAPDLAPADQVFPDLASASPAIMEWVLTAEKEE